MPELPEVETVRVGLQSLIVGKTVTRVDSNWTKSFSVDTPEVDSFVIGSKISAISRRAKVILIVLDTGYTLIIHLKMTGQLVFVPSAQKSKNSNIEGREEERFGAGHPNDSLRGKLPDRSTRVTFVFNDKQGLYPNPYDLGPLTNYNTLMEGEAWTFWFPSMTIPRFDGTKYPMIPSISDSDKKALFENVQEYLKDPIEKGVPATYEQLI